MRSRLVHEWRGIVGGWLAGWLVGVSSLFRLDESLDVRISASGLRAAALISACPTNRPFYTPTIPQPPSFPASYSFSDSHPSCGGRRQLRRGLSSATARHVAGQSSERLPPFSTFISTVGPWNVYGTRKLTAAKSKGRCRSFGKGSLEGRLWEVARVSRSTCLFPQARTLGDAFVGNVPGSRSPRSKISSRFNGGFMYSACLLKYARSFAKLRILCLHYKGMRIFAKHDVSYVHFGRNSEKELDG